MENPKPLLRRTWIFLLGLIIGLLVFGISLLVVHRKHGGGYSMRVRHYMTASKLTEVDHRIIEFREREDKLPDTLAEALQITGADESAIEENFLRDAWGNPIHYEKKGDDYELLSYGPDGQPGGNGLNHDIGPLLDSLYDPAAYPTLAEFVFDMPSEGMVSTCAISGLLAAVLTVTTAFKLPATWQGRANFCFTLVLTTIGGIIVAAVISIAHIPSGH